MQVCLVIPSMSAGGAQRAMSVLVTHLAQRGHAVSLITLERKDTPSFFPLPREIATYHLDKLGGHGSKRLLRVMARLQALRRTILRIGPDIVVSFMDTMNITTLLALYGSGVPVLVAERTDPRKHRIGAEKSLLRRLTYPLADAVVVQTDAVRAAFPRRLRRRIEVIPNPILETPLRARPSVPNNEGRFRVVALGRLDPVKRFDRLTEAFLLLKDRQPNWDLAIIGEGSERARLEALVQKGDASSRVDLLGERTDVHSLLASSHLFAFPSTYEGFPNALGEALAVGLPAVAVRGVNGVELLVHDRRNGILVDEPLATDALAEALDSLMTSPSLRERCGDESLAISREFTPAGVMDRWEALMKHGIRRTRSDTQSVAASSIR